MVLNCYDFAYNHRCFSGILKGLISCFTLENPSVLAFRAKKGGICFEVAYTIKKLVHRKFIVLLLSCSGRRFKRTRNFKLYKFMN